jgi:hypothetical protein
MQQRVADVRNRGTNLWNICRGFSTREKERPGTLGETVGSSHFEMDETGLLIET